MNKSGRQLHVFYEINGALPLIPLDPGHRLSLAGQFNYSSGYFLPEKQLYHKLLSPVNTSEDTSCPHIYEKEKYSEENGIPGCGD